MRSAVVLLALLLSACAAPGSKIGRIALSGTVSESPSDSLSLEVTLPKHYGLGGLDLKMNSPEDFGHKDQTVQVEVVEGRFSFQFPPLAYHATFWLLPPLGAFPKQPPEPAYFVRFSDTPDEVYLVGFYRGSFKYKVFNRTSRQELKPEEATWSFSRGEYVPLEDGKTEVWNLRVEASRSKKAADAQQITPPDLSRQAAPVR
jgi:hypothetical protein